MKPASVRRRPDSVKAGDSEPRFAAGSEMMEGALGFPEPPVRVSTLELFFDLTRQSTASFPVGAVPRPTLDSGAHAAGTAGAKEA
jgi:hypothetical protein